MPEALSDVARRWLRETAGASVEFDVALARHTTLRIGGPADAWCEPDSVDSLGEIVRGCAQRQIPLIPFGGGSNLLVRDGGVRGVVLSTRRLRGLERVGDVGIRVESGVPTSKLLAQATLWELGGVELLAGVPGSVGGALVMNAGTYLGEIEQVTREVSSVRIADGERVRRDASACGFVYRGSALPRDEIVVEARLELTPRPREQIERAVRELRARRTEREPTRVANAGSIFKNPPGDYAGRLIEAAGLKGTRVGDAECSPVHANWLVNRGGARAADMLQLIELVREGVRRTHGVELELELKVIGEG